MGRPKKESSTESINDTVSIETTIKPVLPNDLEWTDYVLNLLSDDEKINGNPTTDGLRRIFEIALNCTVINSTSHIVQSPDVHNEKRATVVHSLTYVLNDKDVDKEIKTKTISGAADVYYGNCDKIFRNHPVAVAETRAEGRALRRALKLRKVVAAEELAKEIEDNPDAHNVSKISSNQLNFMDVLSKRLNINVLKMIENHFGHIEKNIYNIEHDDAITISKLLSSYQQDISKIPESILGYDSNWK